MESVFYTWLSLGLLSIVAEFFIGNTYGFGVGAVAFCAAAVVYFTGAKAFFLVQFIVFAFVSGACAYIFPHVFKKYMGGDEQVYISALAHVVGKMVAVKQVGDSWKAEVDGVDYPIVSDTKIAFTVGQELTVQEVRNGILIVA